MYPPNIQHEKHKKHNCIVSPPLAPIGIRTQVSGFKVPSDNHYTIGAGWFRWESNPEPFPCKGNVITATPRNLKYFLMLTGGLEPPTFAWLIKALVSAV